MNTNNQAPTPLVAVDQLHISIAGRTILKNISLQVAPGEIVTLIGPNGAGKSTLLKAILGLIPIQQGSVQLLPELRIGYMPQSLKVESLMPLTVQRFLMLAPKANAKASLKVAAELELTELLHSPIQTVSGGELQRVLLARALLTNPQLLVLDEPVQGVDITGQIALHKLITKIRNKFNCGILMVSHDLHLVMAGTDSVVCLNQHVCCFGRPETIQNHPEFLSLFGSEASEALAVYAHQHNHTHDLKGNIVDDDQ